MEFMHVPPKISKRSAQNISGAAAYISRAANSKKKTSVASHLPSAPYSPHSPSPAFGTLSPRGEGEVSAKPQGGGT